jgi:hypothetical protein
MASYHTTDVVSKHNSSHAPIAQSRYMKNSKGHILDSDGESDDDSLSDEGLMSDFNATSSAKNAKPRDASRMSPKPFSVKSSTVSSRWRPNDDDFISNSGRNPMMMTMKTPMKPMSKRPMSPTISRAGHKLGTVGENISESEASSEEGDRVAAKKPSFLKSQRPKSPSVLGRQKELLQDDERPKPMPRQQKPQQDKRVTQDGSKSPVAISRHSSHDSLDCKTPPARRTPIDDERRKTPYDDMVRKTPVDDRKSPFGRRKSPDIEEVDADEVDSPVGGKRMVSLERQKSTFSDGRKTPSERHSPNAKSPFEADMSRKSSRQATPITGKKTPEIKKDSSPALQRKGSILDFLTGTANSKSDRSRNRSSDEGDSDTDHRKSIAASHSHHKSSSPSLHRAGSRESVNPFDNIRKSPVGEKKPSKSPVFDKISHKSPTGESRPVKNQKTVSHTVNKKHHQSTNQTKVPLHSASQEKSDDESSICDELIQEPVVEDASSQDKNAASKSHVKQQCSSRQKSDETIELVREAQEPTKMRYINPAETENAKRSERPTSSKGKVPVPVYKPKPRYMKPTVTSLGSESTSTVSFDSTDKIRDVVFNEWKAKRAERVRQQMLEKQKKEKEIEEHKEKEKKDKLENGKVAYQSWLESKKGYVSEVELKKRKEEEKAKMEEEKKRKKKEDAELQFIKWKESVDEKLKEEHLKTIKKKKKTEQEKQMAKQKKENEAERTYLDWKAKTDEELKKEAAERKKKAKEEKEEIKKEQQKQQEEAAQKYLEWLDKKESTGAPDTSYKTNFTESRRAWTPAGGKSLLIGK